MPRIPDRRAPTSRAYALENAAFLRHLRRTGNAHEAARAMNASRSRFTRRRAADPVFATRWAAALAFAQSRLCARDSHPTSREPHLVRRRDGTVQVRVRPATAITPEGEARFLLALASCANVRLAAHAAGYASASFYARKRRHPGFAREWQEALALGYQHLEAALHEGWLEDAHEHDAWAHNTPPAIPPMSVAQALQLMYLHQKEARMLDEPAHIKRRRGETTASHSFRMSEMVKARVERDAQIFRDGEAARRARGERPYWGGEWPDPHEPVIHLPDLSQVTGWSKACPKPAAGPAPDPAAEPVWDGSHTAAGKPALFGGWRIEDMRRRQGEG